MGLKQLLNCFQGKEKKIRVKEHCANLVLSDDQLKEFMKIFNEEIDKGLNKETNPNATIKCFPTYLQDLPTGREKGKFLALDLGGTNFRVLVININEKDTTMVSKIYATSDEIMTGPGEKLFDHIAECMHDMVKEEDLLGQELPLGFTFSFPCKQEALTQGSLVEWTKGFNCSGVVGKNVVKLLEEAIARRKDIKIHVTALLNDTTGCLMSTAFTNQNAKIGVIVGTGSNGCYVEKCENVSTFENKSGKPYIILNCEWGSFGHGGALDFILTEYDKEVDTNSINKGRQIFEKMVAGMYLGEIVRLVLEKFIKEGILFEGQGSDTLFTRGTFLTKYVSEIESEPKSAHAKCMSILRQLGLGHATDQDCRDVSHICECVSRRSAHLVSAAIACLMDRMDFNPITIAVDGSLYRFHPHYHKLMMKKIAQLITKPVKFDIALSVDGSGKGAAFVAAVAASEAIKGDVTSGSIQGGTMAIQAEENENK